MEQENQIYRLTFDVDLPASIGENNALAEAESCCETYIIPTVDEVLSRFENYNIDIESMGLDLGEVKKEEIPGKLKDLLEDEIIRRLYAGAQEQIRDQVYDHKEEHGYGNVGKSVRGIVDDFVSETNQGSYRPDLGIARALLPSLFEGKLPWQYVGSEQNFLPDLWDEVSQVLEDPLRANLFFAGLSKEPLAIYRFVNVLDVEQFKVMLASPIFLGEGISLNLFSVLERIESKESRFSLRHALSVVAYALIRRYDERIDAQRATEKVGNFLAEAKDYPYAKIDDNDDIAHIVFGPETSATIMLKATKNAELIVDDVIQPDDFNGFEMTLGVDGVMRKMEKINKNPLRKDESEPQTQQVHETRELDNKENDFLGKMKAYEQEMMLQKELLMETADNSDANSLSIDDAGLVLLHPFLTNLFGRLGYLDEEQKFRNMDTRERAVHLLRFMAGFIPPYYDHQLVLEKVLCDLPLAFPVALDIELEREEKEEARQVLEAVCQYWAPLNGTSPEGLQRSFLLRQGTVAFEDDTWIVRVEGQALDILLDDLPWEISLLLLPWKEKMIMVEWQRE